MSGPVDVLMPVAEIREDCIINLRKRPDGSRWPVGTKLYAIDGAAVAELIEAQKATRRELHACQAVIHLAGGFDPAYVTGAQAAIKQADAALANVGSAS